MQRHWLSSAFFLHSLEGTALINTLFSSALLPGFQAFSHSNKQDWMNLYLCEIVHSREAAFEKMNTMYVDATGLFVLYLKDVKLLLSL